MEDQSKPVTAQQGLRIVNANAGSLGILVFASIYTSHNICDLSPSLLALILIGWLALLIRSVPHRLYMSDMTAQTFSLLSYRSRSIGQTCMWAR